MEIKEIKRKEDGIWIVNGEKLTTVQLIAKYCPSKTISEDAELWLPSIIHYLVENESPHYGWHEFFTKYNIKEDWKPIDEWDAKYHILLY